MSDVETRGLPARPSRAARPPGVLRVTAWVVLLVSGCVAGVLLLWPWGDQVRTLHIGIWVRTWRVLGSPDWFTPEVSAALANALILVVPVAALTVLLWRVRWWWLVAASVCIGAVVEFVQWRLLPDRVPDFTDAVLNAIGAAIGVAFGVWLRSRRRSVSG